MANKRKVLTEDGVRRLWAAIEQKFIDTSEIESILTEIQDDIEMVPLTTAEIDAITGYTEPEQPAGD